MSARRYSQRIAFRLKKPRALMRLDASRNTSRTRACARLQAKTASKLVPVMVLSTASGCTVRISETSLGNACHANAKPFACPVGVNSCTTAASGISPRKGPPPSRTARWTSLPAAMNDRASCSMTRSPPPRSRLGNTSNIRSARGMQSTGDIRAPAQIGVRNPERLRMIQASRAMFAQQRAQAIGIHHTGISRGSHGQQVVTQPVA